MCFDALGSTDRLTDSAGDTTDNYTYEAYGEVIASTGTTENPYRYVGRLGYYDNGDGSLYVRARHYQPTTARWLSVDPVPTEPRYVYVNGMPVMRTDGSGRKIGPPDNMEQVSEWCLQQAGREAALIAAGPALRATFGLPAMGQSLYATIPFFASVAPRTGASALAPSAAAMFCMQPPPDDEGPCDDFGPPEDPHRILCEGCYAICKATLPNPLDWIHGKITSRICGDYAWPLNVLCKKLYNLAKKHAHLDVDHCKLLCNEQIDEDMLGIMPCIQDCLEENDSQADCETCCNHLYEGSFGEVPDEQRKFLQQACISSCENASFPQ
jgi:RHS repeat-associated protein